MPKLFPNKKESKEERDKREEEWREHIEQIL